MVTGERYRNITKKTEGVLKGEYGTTPAPVNTELQAKVLDGRDAITCRPADLLEPEFEKQKTTLLGLVKEEGVSLVNEVDDTLTYTLFPQVGWKFLKNRNNPDVFEPVPSEEDVLTSASKAKADSGIYTVKVEGKAYVVKVTHGGDVSHLGEVKGGLAPAPKVAVSLKGEAVEISAPLAGKVFNVSVELGDSVAEGDVILVLEAMKMETEIRSTHLGVVSEIFVNTGDAVKVGDVLLTLN
ncbi:MAG: hypothetical protein CM1200mP40_05960 [Gammaproteobacteria bacterium]|nr:MAG: hypothetical protein CM1200mP40_05960 [Gammaproteobacteria bacterium]